VGDFMNYGERLEKLIICKNGLIFTKEVENVGIPRYYLTLFVRENKLERIAHGVYVTPDAFEDTMYIIQSRNNRVIYSHDTALALHDLSDRDPIKLSVTVPYGYNASNLKKNDIKVYTVKRELFLLGVMDLKTEFGRPIKVYNQERTICDIVRSRSGIDVAILNTAIRRYVYSKSKNIPLLLRYAKELGVQNIIRNYLEVLL
jgi:predicted transcriptional regulator of viral defense system